MDNLTIQRPGGDYAIAPQSVYEAAQKLGRFERCGRSPDELAALSREADMLETVLRIDLSELTEAVRRYREVNYERKKR